MKKEVRLPKFVGNSCDFDKNRDIRRVEPASVLLLSEVIASGVIPPTAVDLEYNEVDNPENVVGRVTNTFDALEAQSAILSKKKPVSTPVPDSTPSTE